MFQNYSITLGSSSETYAPHLTRFSCTNTAYKYNNINKNTSVQLYYFESRIFWFVIRYRLSLAFLCLNFNSLSYYCRYNRVYPKIRLVMYKHCLDLHTLLFICYVWDFLYSIQVKQIDEVRKILIITLLFEQNFVDLRGFAIKFLCHSISISLWTLNMLNRFNGLLKEPL